MNPYCIDAIARVGQLSFYIGAATSAGALGFLWLAWKAWRA